jgi:hypothetical protein
MKMIKMNKTSLIITLIGILLLLAGIIAAFLGPVETYCFYLFTEGGRFHYDGFGIGSLMFGNITMQIWGYYLIALVFIPLGYGHLKKQGWIQPISLTLLYVWLIVGIPILFIIQFIILTNKEPSFMMIILYAVLGIISYALITPFLIHFYKSKHVEAILNHHKRITIQMKEYPLQLMILILLYIFYIFIFHVLLLFRGIFPLFGHWLTGLKSIAIISLSILLFVMLIIGTINRKIWSWWVSMIYYFFFIPSLIITFLVTDFSESVMQLNLPELETNALINIPLKGYHLSGIFGIPLIITFIVIFFSKKYFITAFHEGI